MRSVATQSVAIRSVGNMKRKKIKVEKIKLTDEQLKRAREQAEAEFNRLIVWKDKERYNGN